MHDTFRRPPSFGVNLSTAAHELPVTLALAHVVDDAGLDYISLSDHPYNPVVLDTWTLLTYLGARTSQVRLLPNVLTLPLRPPAMLAKAATTLDHLTGGRMDLGLGAGGSWDGIVGYGGPRRTPGEAVGALAEAITVLRALWGNVSAGHMVERAGRYYSLQGAQPGPAPMHTIGIWLGALGPRMLQLTGQRADGWIASTPFIPPEELPARLEVIERAARQVNRDPNTIRRVYNVAGTIVAPHAARSQSVQTGMVVGSVQHWTQELIHYYDDLRMDTFIFAPITDAAEQIRIFIQEVVPAVRERFR